MSARAIIDSLPVLRKAEALGAMGRERLLALVVELGEEIGHPIRHTTTRPRYSREPGWHLLCGSGRDWFHMLDVDGVSREDYLRVVELLSFLVRPGEWTNYAGGKEH